MTDCRALKDGETTRRCPACGAYFAVWIWIDDEYVTGDLQHADRLTPRQAAARIRRKERRVFKPWAAGIRAQCAADLESVEPERRRFAALVAAEEFAAQGAWDEFEAKLLRATSDEVRTFALTIGTDPSSADLDLRPLAPIVESLVAEEVLPPWARDHAARFRSWSPPGPLPEFPLPELPAEPRPGTEAGHAARPDPVLPDPGSRPTARRAPQRPPARRSSRRLKTRQRQPRPRLPAKPVKKVRGRRRPRPQKWPQLAERIRRSAGRRLPVFVVLQEDTWERFFGDGVESHDFCAAFFDRAAARRFLGRAEAARPGPLSSRLFLRAAVLTLKSGRIVFASRQRCRHDRFALGEVAAALEPKCRG